MQKRKQKIDFAINGPLFCAFFRSNFNVHAHSHTLYVCSYFYGAHCTNARLAVCVCEVYFNSHTFSICLQSSERRATPTALALSFKHRDRVGEREKERKYSSLSRRIQNLRATTYSMDFKLLYIHIEERAIRYFCA